MLVRFTIKCRIHAKSIQSLVNRVRKIICDESDGKIEVTDSQFSTILAIL